MKKTEKSIRIKKSEALKNKKSVQGLKVTKNTKNEIKTHYQPMPLPQMR